MERQKGTPIEQRKSARRRCSIGFCGSSRYILAVTADTDTQSLHYGLEAKPLHRRLQRMAGRHKKIPSS